MLYFAYGSNMLTARLRSRCSGAEVVGRATLANHSVRFAKRGMDGSGKATIQISPGSTTHGVLFDIPVHDWPALDAAEGPAYRRCADTIVETPQGLCTCITYQAKQMKDGLEPFDWYLALILAGCHEHALPTHVLEWYQAHPFITDPEEERPGRSLAVRTLEEVGILEVISLALGAVFRILD